MDVSVNSLDLAQVALLDVPMLALLVPQVFKPGTDPLSMLVVEAEREGDFKRKAGSLASYRGSSGCKARRVCLAGVGEGNPASVRQALVAVSAEAKARGAKTLCVATAFDWTAESLALAALGVAEATYSYTTTKPKAEGRQLKQLVLAGAGASTVGDARYLNALVGGVEYAKEWANRPANHCTPSVLAGAARKLERHARVRCKVLGRSEIARLGMGSFLAVAQGSAEAPRFIVLEYRGASERQAPVVLVGKGITFDTGGISIKPAGEMDEMKFDMSGAASVLGVFEALGRLQPAIDVVGLVPACENMPDGRAIKPGDVVTSMSGQTIEILNTDAEGRLILCDALTYAARFKPAALIDIATLTGACVVALGNVRSGLFSNSDALAVALQSAGDGAGDPCWRMPIDDEYAEGLKTNFADVANVAGRWGGAVTAAKFLQRFVGEWPWAHLDIAGTGWKSGGLAKGATGRPVPLLLNYLVGRQAVAAAPRRRPRPSTRKTTKATKA